MIGLAASLLAVPAKAQVSVTLFPAGITQDKQSTQCAYVDVGDKVTAEGWIQNTKGAISEGGDLIIVPKIIGMVAGGDNTGAHLGFAVNLFGVQFRLMKNTSGAVQSVINYSYPFTKRFYGQIWLAPATHDGSAYFVGVGYYLKK